MRPGHTGAGPAGRRPPGMATDGIGIVRLTLIHSSPATESSSTRSAGASTPHGARLGLRITGTVTAVTGAGTVIGAVAITIISDQAIVRATRLAVAFPGPLGTHTAFVAPARAALAVAAVSGEAAVVSTVAEAVSAAVAAEVSTAVVAAEGDTAVRVHKI